MKTVYRFYQKYDDNILDANMDLDIQDKYPLYALTNNKKLAKEFMNQRNMDMFILRKSKMEEDEYITFANRNSSSVLSPYEYTYYDRNNNFKECDTTIVSTWNEREILSAIMDDTAQIDETLSYDVVPFIFDKKYVKALDTLGYVAFWKLYGNVNKYRDVLTEEELDFADDYSFPDVKYDEVSLFINMYSYTMK